MLLRKGGKHITNRLLNNIKKEWKNLSVISVVVGLLVFIFSEIIFPRVHQRNEHPINVEINEAKTEIIWDEDPNEYTIEISDNEERYTGFRYSINLNYKLTSGEINKGYYVYGNDIKKDGIRVNNLDFKNKAGNYLFLPKQRYSTTSPIKVTTDKVYDIQFEQNPDNALQLNINAFKGLQENIYLILCDKNNNAKIYTLAMVAPIKSISLPNETFVQPLNAYLTPVYRVLSLDDIRSNKMFDNTITIDYFFNADGTKAENHLIKLDYKSLKTHHKKIKKELDEFKF